MNEICCGLLKGHQTRSRRRPSGLRPNSFSVLLAMNGHQTLRPAFAPLSRRGLRPLRTRSRRMPYLIRHGLVKNRSSIGKAPILDRNASAFFDPADSSSELRRSAFACLNVVGIWMNFTSPHGMNQAKKDFISIRRLHWQRSGRIIRYCILPERPQNCYRLPVCRLPGCGNPNTGHR